MTIIILDKLLIATTLLPTHFIIFYSHVQSLFCFECTQLVFKLLDKLFKLM